MKKKFLFVPIFAVAFLFSFYHWSPLILFQVGCFFSPEKIQAGYKIQSIGQGRVSLEKFSISTGQMFLEADRCDVSLFWDWRICQLVARVYLQKPSLEVKDFSLGKSLSWTTFLFPKWIRWYIGSSPGRLSIGESAFSWQVDAENQQCSLGIDRLGVSQPFFFCSWQPQELQRAFSWSAKICGVQVEEVAAFYNLFKKACPELPVLTQGKVRLSAQGNVDSTQGFSCSSAQMDVNDVHLAWGDVSLQVQTAQSGFVQEDGFFLSVEDSSLFIGNQLVATNIKGTRERGVWTFSGEHKGLGSFHVSLLESVQNVVHGELGFNSQEGECSLELASSEKGGYTLAWALPFWDLPSVHRALSPFVGPASSINFISGLVQGEGSLFFDFTNLKIASVSDWQGQNVTAQLQEESFFAQSMTLQWGWQDSFHQWEFCSCNTDVGFVQEPLQLKGALSWKNEGYYLTGSLSLQDGCVQFGGVVSDPWSFSLQRIKEGWFRGEGVSEKLYASLIEQWHMPFSISGCCNFLGALEQGVIDCTIMPQSCVITGEAGRLVLGQNLGQVQPVCYHLSLINGKWSLDLPFAQERLDFFALPGMLQDSVGKLAIVGDGEQVNCKLEIRDGIFLYQGTPTLEKVSFDYEDNAASKYPKFSSIQGKCVYPGFQSYGVDMLYCKQTPQGWKFQGGIVCNTEPLCSIKGETLQETRIFNALLSSPEGRVWGKVCVDNLPELTSLSSLNLSSYQCVIPSLNCFDLELGECSITIKPGKACWLLEGILGDEGQVSCGITTEKNFFQLENLLFSWRGTRFLGDSSFLVECRKGFPFFSGKILGKWQRQGDGQKEISLLHPVDFFWEPLNWRWGVSDLVCFSEESTLSLGELCFQEDRWMLSDGKYSLSSDLLEDVAALFAKDWNDHWVDYQMISGMSCGKYSGLVSPLAVEFLVEVDGGENIKYRSDKLQETWVLQGDEWCIKGKNMSSHAFFPKTIESITGKIFGCVCDLYVSPQAGGLQGSLLADFDKIPAWVRLPAGVPFNLLGKAHSFSGQFFETEEKIFEGSWSGLGGRLGVLELASVKADLSVTSEMIVLQNVEVKDPAIQGKILLAKVEKGLLTLPEARLTQCFPSQLSLGSKRLIHYLPFKIKKWVLDDVTVPLTNFSQCQAKGRIRFETLWEQMEKQPLLCSLEKRDCADCFPDAGELDYEISGGAFILKQLRNCFGKKVQQSFFLGTAESFFGLDGLVSIEVGCQQREGERFYVNWQGFLDSSVVEVSEED